MTNGMSKVSLLAVASLTSALIVFFPPAWVAALVLGVVALMEIKQSGGALRGRGLAWSGIVLSILWIVLLVVFVAVSLTAAPQESADWLPPLPEDEETLNEPFDFEDFELPATPAAEPAESPAGAAPAAPAPTGQPTTPTPADQSKPAAQ